MTLDDDTARQATFLGMCVRNALEGRLHGGELGSLSLSDEQMAILNPIVRNAIATGLYAQKRAQVDPRAAAYVLFQQMLVPDYWERPELLNDQLTPWDSGTDLLE